MKISGVLLLSLVLSTACVSVRADHTIHAQSESFSANGVTTARLETGAGSLTIIGMPDQSEIEVRAEYKCGSGFSVDTQRILDNLRLNMEVRGTTFYLKSERSNDWGWGESGRIDIVINMPSEIKLDVDDGSGQISISGMGQDIRIKDGSGGIELTNINGNIVINDGSGSIRLRDTRQDVEITDGSGSIDARYVGGNLHIRDGSGSIDVDDVGGDLTIPSDGSGSINVRNAQRDVEINDGSGSIEVRHVGGSVRIRDGSGSINVDDVSGDLNIPSEGSGSLHYSRISGRVNVPK